jgi:hypothetical protein
MNSSIIKKRPIFILVHILTAVVLISFQHSDGFFTATARSVSSSSNLLHLPNEHRSAWIRFLTIIAFSCGGNQKTANPYTLWKINLTRIGGPELTGNRRKASDNA